MNKQNRNIPITQKMVEEAYKIVKQKGKAAGVDGETVAEFEKDKMGNLYVIWNRLGSGSYFPPAVKQVTIPKGEGKRRELGIPTLRDRIAQTVIKGLIEANLNKIFCEESYGYRPGKNAHEAIIKVRRNCWDIPWVIDLDIENFFDKINHDLLMKAVSKHVDEKWIKMYIKRWLEASVMKENGELVEKRGLGTPQGGVLSPLLANLFLHYVLDIWLKQRYPKVRFVRYADDIIIHSSSRMKAEEMLENIKKRLLECRLNLNGQKTKIVYCKNGNRKQKYGNIKFDFLGYSFQPRKKFNRRSGKAYLGFDAAISIKSEKKVMSKLREIKLVSNLSNINKIAEHMNPLLRGWLNYYGKVGGEKLSRIFSRVEWKLAKWLKSKYKRLKNRRKKGFELLYKIRKLNPNLFEHWKAGYLAY